MKLLVKCLLTTCLISCYFLVLMTLFPSGGDSLIYSNPFFAIAAVSFGLILTIQSVHLDTSSLNVPVSPEDADIQNKFISHLENAIRESELENTKVGVMLINIHPENNAPSLEMLGKLRQDLISTLHSDDAIFTPNSGNIAIILSNIPSPEVTAHVADKILKVLSYSGNIYPVKPCIGISLCPIDSNSANILIHLAEIALDSAIKSGGNTYVLAHNSTGLLTRHKEISMKLI